MDADAVGVVTGASRGIGAAVSRRLARLGAQVLLVARHRERLEELAAQIESEGGRAELFAVDLTQEEEIAALGETIRKRYGRCDVLVNNAGISRMGAPLHAMQPADWDELMATNLRAPYLMIRALAPLMIERQSGHIVNISSLAGHNPLRNGAAYSASKWALNGLTYSVAEELRDYGVRVSVIAPGSVNTSFGGHEPANAAARIQPEDIADIVAMLMEQRPQSFVSEVLIRPARKP
ncbi:MULTISPECIES: SDR family oxidoreductase [Acidobacterium]|uniref:Clavaldehyde dehydrogenase n=1 Tax=Acidobacterium capsulatum (strain ATCC 51196 / DSM 11244 / BCRC 80197 / JCM 7670 / NBRC 15755 / NCIMB 13165 / 161) TaxID=240015 RepID=C1F3F3_ACIC5|nr:MULTISPECIES: SDR family oxidoreductase [Acidobacterium]ACO32910.1 clavaldehyde dehydrogenase [Acidobacterium capsulatum ATCC 51196]